MANFVSDRRMERPIPIPTYIFNSETELGQGLHIPGRKGVPKYHEHTASVLGAAKNGHRTISRDFYLWCKERASNVMIDEDGHYWTKDQFERCWSQTVRESMDSGYCSFGKTGQLTPSDRERLLMSGCKPSRSLNIF